MSVLVILIAPRARGTETAAPPGEFGWVLSPDGLTVGSQGRSPAALLPRADNVVAVLPDAELSWHRITVPKAPAARLRAALAGVLEEALLDDDDALHLALAPGAVPGQIGWVAAADKAWLATLLEALEGAGVPVDRVVPSSWPDANASGHFGVADAGEDAAPHLALAHRDGVACVALSGGLARAMLARLDVPVRWTAHPGAAAAAERWLESPVAILTDAERALQSARSMWNLRQFDLVSHHRGTLALRDLWRRLMSPEWRPVRIGVLALAVLNVVGLNAWAWQLGRTLDGKRRAMVTLLQAAHPQVRAVLDAPLQMETETERLRAGAGRVGSGDLEPLLAAAAAAWPQGQPPIQALRFEPGRLTLQAPGWTDQQLAPFRDGLRAQGYGAELSGGQVVVSRTRGAKGAA